MYAKDNREVDLQDCFRITEESSIYSRLSTVSALATPTSTGVPNSNPALVPGGAASTIPGPMELSAAQAHRRFSRQHNYQHSSSQNRQQNLEQQQQQHSQTSRLWRDNSDLCVQCGGRGHWAHACPTPKEWKSGDQVARPPPRQLPGRGYNSGRNPQFISGSANAVDARWEQQNSSNALPSNTYVDTFGNALPRISAVSESEGPQHSTYQPQNYPSREFRDSRRQEGYRDDAGKA